jgi:hypothetical protein
MKTLSQFSNKNNQQHGQFLLYPYITGTSISVDFINI